MYLYLKHIIDLLLSTGLLILLFPLHILIVLLIYLDDGLPILFTQKRVGKSGNIFYIYKYRTMINNADDYLDDDGKPSINRVTRAGKILRKFSLDELPQIVNILKGDMSLVGPRPILEERAKRLTKEQLARNYVRPGLTGLAQVNGRNEIPWSKRLQYDVQYVRTISFILDIKIILKTFLLVFTGFGISEDRNPDIADDV